MSEPTYKRLERLVNRLLIIAAIFAYCLAHQWEYEEKHFYRTNNFTGTTQVMCGNGFKDMQECNP